MYWTKRQTVRVSGFSYGVNYIVFVRLGYGNVMGYDPSGCRDLYLNRIDKLDPELS
jgi:hypothetical protein